MQFASHTEVVRACGNSLVFLNVHSQQQVRITITNLEPAGPRSQSQLLTHAVPCSLQRLLLGSGNGIQCFDCSAKAGIIAVAEQVGYMIVGLIVLSCSCSHA